MDNPWEDMDQQVVQAVYWEAAAAMGRSLNQVLTALDTHETRDRWMVLSSTNGLSMGELWGNKAYPHEFAFYDLVLDRTVHVPLVILGPGQGHRLVEQVVELVDVVPTMLGLASAVLPHSLPGQDLLTVPFEEEPAATAYVEFGDMLAVRQGPYLLTVRAMLHNTTSLHPGLTRYILREGVDHGYWLHDVDADPLQRQHRISNSYAIALWLKEIMVDIRTGSGALPLSVQDSPLLKEALEQESRGYW
jgi:arylsulfatase A-like enzyme